MSYPQNLSKSDQKWLDIIHECRASGQSDNQWLEEHNIKSPTFYYHVKKLRQKACELPKRKQANRNDVQEVVPLIVDEPVPIITDEVTNNSLSITHGANNIVNDSIAIRLTIQGVGVEIANNATQKVIQSTLAALRFLC
ncbi:MAG: hypothetical protein R3Y47_13215 [Lachnospiraceae bacterium]